MRYLIYNKRGDGTSPIPNVSKKKIKFYIKKFVDIRICFIIFAIFSACLGILFICSRFDNPVKLKNLRIQTNAVHQNVLQLHGVLGPPKGSAAAYNQTAMPLPINHISVNKEKELREGGGFYLALSNALPLDRSPPDNRDRVCHTVQFNYTELESLKATVVITFYEEPHSTLFRTVHSILNKTPPRLLDEIILVNDGESRDTEHMRWIESYAATLPKVVLIHLEKNAGIVQARLTGARAVKSPTMIIMDSHVEVNDVWIEPLLQRLYESPTSLVMPQIDSILGAEDFSFTKSSGIGCRLGILWTMVERAFASEAVDSAAAIESPALAGGIYGIRMEWFWKSGGYDEFFTSWGAENVEQALRLWSCGGKVECMPCSRVYHIYRVGGTAYTVPKTALWRNRFRTAAVWLDDMSVLTYLLSPYYTNNNLIGVEEDSKMVYKVDGYKGPMLGDLTKMMTLKDELNCQPFNYFKNRFLTKDMILQLSDIYAISEFRNVMYTSECIDSLQHKKNDKIGAFGCHNSGGTQKFLLTKEPNDVYLLRHENHLCVDGKLVFDHCKDIKGGFQIFDNSMLIWVDNREKAKPINSENISSHNCLTLFSKNDKLPANFEANELLELTRCSAIDNRQRWKFMEFDHEPYSSIKLTSFM